MNYVAVLEGDGDNYGAFVPDVGGAVGAGDTAEQALESVAQSLAIQLADFKERGVDLPKPTPADRVDVSEFEPDEPYRLVEIAPAAMNPVSLSLRDELDRSGLTQKELADRLGVKQPVVSRLMDPFYWGHSSASLRSVAAALGLEVRVKFVPSERRRRARGGGREGTNSRSRSRAAA